MTTAVILSGGKGTRLSPLTDSTPKPMLLLGGIPHLEYQLSLLRDSDIKDIVFSTGYLHEQISDYFGNGSKYGLNLRYKTDGSAPLGTAGALRNCMDYIAHDGSREVLVLNGDILTDIDLVSLISAHKEFTSNSSGITMSLLPVSDPSQYGVAVLKENLILDFIEKPVDTQYGNLINAGIYVFSPEIVSNIPQNRFIMLESDIFPQYCKKSQLFGLPNEKMYWLDIGTHERLDKANKDCHDSVFSVKGLIS